LLLREERLLDEELRPPLALARSLCAALFWVLALPPLLAACARLDFPEEEDDLEEDDFGEEEEEELRDAIACSLMDERAVGLMTPRPRGRFRQAGRARCRSCRRARVRFALPKRNVSSASKVAVGSTESAM
jgi:hypothetical protein